jgi:hypothetical protein
VDRSQMEHVLMIVGAAWIVWWLFGKVEGKRR